MGSFDNSDVISEQLRGSVTRLVGCPSQPTLKQDSRQEMDFSSSISVEGQMFEQQGTTITNTYANVLEQTTFGYHGSGTAGDSERLNTMLLNEGLDSDSGVSGPCLMKEIDACDLNIGDCLIEAPAKVERHCTNDLSSPSHVCEPVSNSVSSNELASKFLYQNELDTSRGGCSFSEIVDRIADGSTGTKPGPVNEIPPLQRDCMLSVHAEQIDSNSDQYDCQTDEKRSSCSYGETVIELAGRESNHELCLQMLPQHGCQGFKKFIQTDDSLTIHALGIDQCDEKIVSDSSSKFNQEVVEAHDTLLMTNVNNGIGKIIYSKFQNDCNSKEATFQINPCVAHASAAPSKSPPDQKYGLSEMYSVVDLPPKDVCSANSCNAEDLDYNDIKILGCVSEIECPDSIAAFSQSNGRNRASSQKIKLKKASRKGKKKVSQSQQDVEMIFDTARRRRSCISKPARASLWGSLGCITQYFEKNDSAVVNQCQKEGNHKSRGNKGGANRNKKQLGESSHRSRKGAQVNCATSTNRIRLKVKLGNKADKNFLNIVVPKVVDPSMSSKAISCSYGNESYWEGNLEIPPLAPTVEDQKVKEGTVRQIFCYSSNQEEEKKSFDVSVLKEKHADANICITSHLVDTVERASETGGLDPGTSPDSEVINSVLDIQVGAIRQENLHDSILVSSDEFAASANLSSISNKKERKDRLCLADSCAEDDGSSVPESRNRSKSSKKHGRRLHADNRLGSSETFTSFFSVDGLSNSLTSKELSTEQVSLSTETKLPEEAIKAKNILEVKACCRTDIDNNAISESENSTTLFSSQSAKTKPRPTNSSKSMKTVNDKSKDPVSENAIKNVSKQRVYQRKSVKKTKAMKGVCDQVATQTESHQVVGNCLVDNPEKSDDIIASTSSVNLNTVQGAVSQCTPPRNAWVLCDDCHKWRRIPASLVDSLGHASCTWTCKENVDKAFADCSIPQEKSNAEINAELEISDDSGEENASNKRLTYRELECFNPLVHAAPQENKFASISTNHFLHRNRKTQNIDEIMVCHCKPPLEGRLGCGDECLNRMLNIECVRGTCPCGDLCSNQQFQKRKYAKLKWLRCGRKGYGLQLLEDLSKGKFLIEYVGEVLDMHAYESRQKEYALNGHRHFYFMTLNGSEVIDACGKGNLGRFINHSCDPNCRTEKWMVNGEICIGLFALRDIKKGEEVTFDYNYVRVFGAAAKKCYCGSPQCRGYIGGDPLNSEVIIQSDSDEEFPEPVMLRADGRGGNNNLPTVLRSSSGASKMPTLGSMAENRDKRDESIPSGILIQSKVLEEKEDIIKLSASTVSPLHSSLEFEDSKVASPDLLPEITQQTEDVTSKQVLIDQRDHLLEDTGNRETSSGEQVAKSLSDDISSHKKSKMNAVADKQGSLKSQPRMKTSQQLSTIKKGKVSSSSLNVEKVHMIRNKLQMSSFKPKRLIDGYIGSRFEAVEEKLNELLDAEGGISKRKDAPKGYLKLLLLTVASGANGNGEAIQSNRDLSMILDALLKTKSRVVLNDIISKNGLRMLHNIMKQYRGDFKKIPILRKLLKVLEYLVAREILTSEHINGGPPCPGMESLKESLLSLTEHDDKQVHQIARHFRDKWFPRHLRTFGYMEREDGRSEGYRGSNCNRFTISHSYRHDQDSRPTEAIDCVKHSMVTPPVDTRPAEDCSTASTGGQSLNGQKTRKRKSRWDQPADTNLDLRSKEQKLESAPTKQFVSGLLNGVGIQFNHLDRVNRDVKNSSGSSIVSHQGEAIRVDSGVLKTREDIPPGFSTPFNSPLASSSACSTVLDPPRQSIGNSNCSFSTVGHLQERFISRFPVSYGIPFSIIQRYGTSCAKNPDSWVVAPGMPFHPFPPLPSYPRGQKGPPTPPCDAAVRKSAQELQFNSHDSQTFLSEENTSSTTGTTSQQDLVISSNYEPIYK